MFTMVGFAANWRLEFPRNGNMPANGWRWRLMDSAKQAGTPSFYAGTTFDCETRREKLWQWFRLRQSRPPSKSRLPDEMQPANTFPCVYTATTRFWIPRSRHW